MACIKAIIFDLGNCIIGFDHRIGIKKILRFTDKTEEQIYDLFFDSELTRQFERGKLGPEEFFDVVRSGLELEINYPEFLPIWNDIFFPIPGTEDFIRSLPSGLSLVLLSNINKLHYEHIKDRFASTLALFNRIIPSYTTGFIKPERKIYDLAIKATNEVLENILYIDDRLDLVLKAREYGITSIQFKGIVELRGDLIALGISMGKTSVPA